MLELLTSSVCWPFRTWYSVVPRTEWCQWEIISTRTNSLSILTCFEPSHIYDFVVSHPGLIKLQSIATKQGLKYNGFRVCGIRTILGLSTIASARKHQRRRFDCSLLTRPLPKRKALQHLKTFSNLWVRQQLDYQNRPHSHVLHQASRHRKVGTLLTFNVY